MMDPLDPGKNVEGSGYSKRRISSILKAPRKSSVSQATEQQENEVESSKPVEKRNSRRVSFAPANDVRLFEDAKNASPARSPLQELMGAATAATQNRVQSVASENTAPQIVGIETLLNAPLHASQQRIMVHFDTGNDFGEKTIMFSAEDAVMDMTHSHTMNIYSAGELPGDVSQQNIEVLLSGGEENVIDVPPSHSVQATNQSSLLVDKKADSTFPTTAPLLDPDFKSFLSSLSKPSPSSASAPPTGMTPLTGLSSDETKLSFRQSKTQSVDVDQENHVPNSLSISKNVSKAFHGSNLHSEEDVSMDMTGAQTDRILGGDDEVDPFQCLFPTQDMYEKCERGSPKAREIKKQQSLESNDLKAKKTSRISSVNTPHESRKIKSVLKGDSREKTVDEFMDVTHCHTGKINSSSLTSTLSANCFEPQLVSLLKTINSEGNPEGSKIQPIAAPSSKQTLRTDGSLTQHKMPRSDSDHKNSSLSTNRSCGKPLSNTSPEGDTSMDITEVQTGHIMGVLGSDDPFQFLIPAHESQPLCESQKKEVSRLGLQKIGKQSSDHTGVETSSMQSLQLQRHQQDKVVSLNNFREKPMKFSSVNGCLNVTQSHPVSIAMDSKLESCQSIYISPTCENNTTRFTADDVAMDMTQCLSVNIGTNLASDLITSIRKQEDSSENRFSSSYSFSHQTPNDCDADPLATESSAEFLVYQEDDMDVTEAQTGRILGAEVSMNVTGFQTDLMVEMPQEQKPFQTVLPTEETHHQRLHGKTGGITGQQHNETSRASSYAGTEILKNTPFKTMIQRNQVECDLKYDCREKKVRFPAADGRMDVTRCNIVNISSDLPLPNRVLPENGEKTVRFNISDVTRSHTANIAHNLNVLERTKGTLLPADGERTQRFCGSDAKMDVTKSQAVNIMRDFPLQSFPNSAIPPNGEKTVIFDVNDATMDVTRSHTVDIAHNLNVLEHTKLNLLTADGERTQRFCASDAEMDVTKSQAVNIMREFPLQSFPNRAIPPNGEKTVIFDVNDATMDVTRSHTVDIAHNLNVLERTKLSLLPADGERTQRFCASDAEMDVTKSQAVNMREFPLQSFPNRAIPPNGEKTVIFNVNDATMDVTRSHTVNITHNLNLLEHTKLNLLPADGERTQRFCASDAEMDVTKSQTVNIIREFPVGSFPNGTMPPNGEKTVKFNTSEAAMDVTRSHTVRIYTDVTNKNLLPTDGERTVRFTTNEANMEVTRSHTVNIVQDLNLPTHQKVDILPNYSEKTVRFGVNDAEMELTKCLTLNILASTNVAPDLTVNQPCTREESLTLLSTNDVTVDLTRSHTSSIVTDLDKNPTQIMESLPTDTETINNTHVDETGCDTRRISKNYKLSYHNVELLPTSGDKTPKFTTVEATMEMALPLNGNIVSNQLLDPVIADQNVTSVNENMYVTLVREVTDSRNCGLDSNPSSSAQSENSLNNSLSQMSCAQGKLKEDATCLDCTYSPLKTNEPCSDAENESRSLVLDVVSKPVNKTKTSDEEIYASLGMCEDQTETLDKPPQGVSSKEDPHSTSFNDLRSDRPLGSSMSDKTENVKEQQPKAETQALSQKTEGSSGNADQNPSVLPSRISRQKSLADLQSKVRRLSQLIKAAPGTTDMENCTDPLAHPDPELDKNPNGKPSPTSVVEPVLEMDLGNNTNDTTTKHPTVATSTTPFTLKTKQLMSRLSVGGFKPKLPQRNTTNELKKAVVEGKPTKTFTVCVPSQLSTFDKIPDIYDEELVDCEDLSEIMDTMTPEKISGKKNTSNLFMFQPSEDDYAFMDNVISSSQRPKRGLSDDEDDKENEKRQKMGAEFAEMTSRPDVECDDSVTTAQMQTIDSSSSIHTSSKCEIASESTFKHSLFESHLEDYDSNGQKLQKLEDGSITVLEFFNLFNIDFVIHNPRQSVLPGRILDTTDVTSLDLLKDKHISRPRQTVYERDVQTLTEKVEGLKCRMQDLSKPLRIVNRPVWEEVRDFTEKELKSFGAKIKERNNFLRKNSKVQSHEMKEVLYANLNQVNLEEQQKLRGTISKADEMIESLDSCISELEAELNAVEETGSEDKPSLKSLEEEMAKVTESLADRNRQISELELGKNKNWSDLKKLKTKERALQNRIETLNMLSEWRLEEKEDYKDNCSVYTFLHGTLFLQLVFEKTNGDDAESRSERKITNISFTFNLNDEKSQFHARLVHKLVSGYIEGESGWVEKYPTSGDVPKLLHDVSLVLSRCRLLGEELRLLKMWGSLRFDILHISSSETHIHIVFSCLKKRSKFEVVFAASLTNQLCVFHVESFKNLIGSTTTQQIEEVVSSLSPGKKLFTRIIKKLHETLLS